MPTAQHNQYEIYYAVSGSGPALVLLHSFLCDGEMWKEQVAPLSEHYRVINIDIRGHGRSSAADQPLDIYDLVLDVIAVLDKEGVESATWAGLSIGGMIALRAALTVPKRVAGLMLLDSHAGTETGFKKFKYRAMVAAAKLFGIKPLLPKVSKLMFGQHTLTTQPELVQYWKGKFATMPLLSIEHMVDALCNRDSLKTQLGEIQQPALVLVGEEDLSLPPPCSISMAERLPDAQLKVVEKAGHLSSLEQPEAVTKAMLEFMREHQPPQSEQKNDSIRST
ncbi:alpha/beta fold hydrolase [Microbulbifer marinus]|uniref:Pimeloyl-ACP methyl ester carboxylesterase n=1 Tax=Microbulbifer marinus TaxID=658218 RepID=A0A1H3VRU3_9GAMM|nr:alpha/beta fold hydrolase [Microbulbifer marinus]SDZ77489.1 Pimeloyl-ACP methyl ester carboxylesterase [Microbulbifer marinus]